MKSLIIASVILVVIVLSTIFSACYTDKLLTDTYRNIDRRITVNDYERALVEIEEIKSDYKRSRAYYVMFLREKDAHNTEAYIEDLKSAILSKDEGDIIAAKNRLLLHIEQLRRLSVFGLESIF